MKSRTLGMALVSAGAAFVLAIAAGDAAAKPKSKVKTQAWFHYAVQFSCGVNGESPSVLAGAYATSANAHNANTLPATLNVNAALSYPPGAMVEGEVSAVTVLPLGPGAALHVTCADLATFPFPSAPPAGYTEGVLVIESSSPLNVTAIYTAGEGESSGEGEVGEEAVEPAEPSAGHVSSMQVVHVPERMVQRSVSDKVTICHLPPGNPENAQTIVVGASAVPAHTAHGDTLGACPVVEEPLL